MALLILSMGGESPKVTTLCLRRFVGERWEKVPFSLFRSFCRRGKIQGQAARHGRLWRCIRGHRLVVGQ